MAKRHFGTVRQRASGRWQALYYYEGRLRSAGTFRTKADALVYLSTIDADLHRGAWIDPKAGKTTLDEYAERWLEQRNELAFRTRELYGYLLELHVLPTLGRTALINLAPSTIRSWHASLAQMHPSTTDCSSRRRARWTERGLSAPQSAPQSVPWQRSPK